MTGDGGFRVEVDWDLCESHGQCEFAAPNVFTIDDDGELQVLDEAPPEGERANVELAVRRCPTRALRLVTTRTTADGTSVR